MAKTLDLLKDIRKQMVINMHTSGASDHVATQLKESAWTGEIAVQHFADDNAAMWTLGNDNTTAIEFISRKTIEGLIASASSLEISAVTPSSSGVLEEFVLKNIVTSAICGEHIKIYKDKTLHGAYLGHVDDVCDPDTGIVTPGSGNTALCLIFILADGKYSLVAIDVEHFLEENEFKSGVTATNHIVHGVVASGAQYHDEFLFVNGDGFYTSGLSEAISAISVTSSASTILVGERTASGTNLEVNIDNKTIGKGNDGVLGTLLLIASATPSATNVKKEYKLVDKDGDEISGSEHIKVYQNCELSGETKDEAIAAADRLGHVTVDSTMTSAGTVVYTVDKYDVASNSALTELSAATIESADTLYKMILSGMSVSSGHTILVGNPTISGTNLEVNIDNKTIGKSADGVLETLLLIASATPSATNVKGEYKLVDKDGHEISGSTHIKVYQNCELSGETKDEAIAAADKLGHVTVDSSTTSGVVVYLVDGYDIASNSALTELSAWTMDYVGSGWVASSITEVIVEDEKITAAALNDLNDKINGMNFEDSAVTNWYVSKVDQSSGVISTTRVKLPVVEVKNKFDSLSGGSANVVFTTDSASTVSVDFSRIIIDCGTF